MTEKLSHLRRFKELFSGSLPAVIGMIHVKALPGTPNYQSESMNKIIEHACEEARLYQSNGINGILLENMNDVPYLNRNVGPEIIAGMTAVCLSVKREVGKLPCGIQILAGCNEQAVAVAKACSMDFVRAEGFVFSHIADEGIMNADAGNLLRYRKKIEANNIMIFTDVKKKHSSHALTSDLNLTDVAKAAEYFLSDGIIVTGSHTGNPVKTEDMNLIFKSNLQLPILIGSGVDTDNLQRFMNAHGLIIGSHFKECSDWRKAIDIKRLSVFMKRLHQLQI